MNVSTALAVAVALAGCAASGVGEPPKNPVGDDRHHDDRHGGGPAASIDFSPPEDVPDEFWCQASSLPETRQGAGQCFREAELCRSRSQHLWRSYQQRGAVPPCREQSEVYCFDMQSRGTLHEVCRASAEGCADHHRTQTRDGWVNAITPSCEERP